MILVKDILKCPATNLIFIEEHPQLFDTDSEVSLIELIRDVPAKRTKVTALLNQTMEET